MTHDLPTHHLIAAFGLRVDLLALLSAAPPTSVKARRERTKLIAALSVSRLMCRPKDTKRATLLNFVQQLGYDVSDQPDLGEISRALGKISNLAARLHANQQNRKNGALGGAPSKSGSASDAISVRAYRIEKEHGCNIKASIMLAIKQLDDEMDACLNELDDRYLTKTEQGRLTLYDRVKSHRARLAKRRPPKR